jgi:RHS repeat-associated protein
VVWAADYLPFGQADVIVGTVDNNLRFAGQYYDQETGLHYNYHRYYDPQLGRYLRADPIGLAGGINLYAYVRNNPVNLIDPDGLKGFGVTYGMAWTVPGYRGSFHLELRIIHDDTKSWYDISAYSGGLTSTAGWHNPDCEGKAEGLEIDWGSDFLFSNANNISDILDHSMTDIGISAGILQGFDFELSSMTNADGTLTGVRELSVGNPLIPFPASANIGAEYHVGGKGFTLGHPVFGANK